jgi:hypothetical protein
VNYCVLSQGGPEAGTHPAHNQAFGEFLEGERYCLQAFQILEKSVFLLDINLYQGRRLSDCVSLAWVTRFGDEVQSFREIVDLRRLCEFSCFQC